MHGPTCILWAKLTRFSLKCNWTALGLSPTETRLHVPSVSPFQTANVGVFAPDHVFQIAAAQGGLLVIAK